MDIQFSQSRRLEVQDQGAGGTVSGKASWLATAASSAGAIWPLLSVHPCVPFVFTGHPTYQIRVPPNDLI